MGSFKELLESLFSNAKTKVNDPLFGPFIFSWVVWNWSQVALLIFGEDKVSTRINQFQNYISAAGFLNNYYLHLFPFLSALIYVFGLPWVKYWFNGLQGHSDKRLYTQAVERDVLKYKELEGLNKVKLLSDPSKKFLEQVVQNEVNLAEAITAKAVIDKQKAEHELDLLRVKNNTQELELKNAQIRYQEASAASIIKKLESENETKRLEEDMRKIEQQSTLSKKHFQIESQKNNATQAANRFPSSFMFMERLSEILKNNGSAIPVDAMAAVIALIFGYESYQDLLKDSDFDNDQFSDVNYVFYDEALLSKGLQSIVSSGNLSSFGVSEEDLFDSVLEIFENLPYKYVNEQSMKDICEEYVNENKYDLLINDMVSDVMAVSDTTYEDIYIDSVDEFYMEDEMICTISATASGAHISDAEVPGRKISISITVKSDVLVGGNALGELTMSVRAELVDYS